MSDNLRAGLLNGMNDEKRFHHYPWFSPRTHSLLLPAFTEPLAELEAEAYLEEMRDQIYLLSREHQRLHKDGDKA